MLVTFISECEKNALKKSRRVLDAFADRIGERTWQTVITEDGLLAVKKLLRKTASKNTSVACHWIRSRARSELVWVVGNRRKFNFEGIIPVNRTQKELFMDIGNNKPQEGLYYANTHFQPLAEHLFAVGYVAMRIHQTIFPNNDQISQAIFIAGCLHDIGKIDPQFQSWVKSPKRKNYASEDGQHIDETKFSFEKHPRHNEISALLYQLLDDRSIQNFSHDLKNNIRHAIYWHHAKPYRKVDIEKSFATYWGVLGKFTANNASTDIRSLINKAIDLIQKISDIACQKNGNDSGLSECYLKQIDNNKIKELENGTPLPMFKHYEACLNDLGEYRSYIAKNSTNNIFRACVITADRLISSLSSVDLLERINELSFDDLLDKCTTPISNLNSHIDSCLMHPSYIGERNIRQSEVAQKLSQCRDIAVLAGPAGCGKTKIALEWAKLKKAQQIIWVCPRVQVCQGLFYELSSEQYLPDANIEIFTGEYKFTQEWGKVTNEESYFKGDIVITTIDQVLNNIITHTKADSLISFLDAHVVFDEYHEYVNMPAFNLFFAELVHCKRFKGEQANTLLVSATPHFTFIDNMFGDTFDSRYDVVEMESFNNSRYRIEFSSYDEDKQGASNPLYTTQSGNTIVISNAATTAQRSFIKNQKKEKAVLYHSKYIKSDKQKWFEVIYESFKRNGLKNYEVLRSGPIVQASLNITCDAMISDMCSAENFLQRMGRLDRFGENQTINHYTIAVPQLLKATKGVCKFLSSMNEFASAKAWISFLESKLINQEYINLPFIYSLYREFHMSNTTRDEIENDLKAALIKSVNLIMNRVTDPIRLIHNKTNEENRKKISKNSLRGDNRFVQLAVCKVNEKFEINYENHYAYEIPLDDSQDIDNITMESEIIEGFGKSEKSLLAHMAKKHHQMTGGKAPFKDYLLMNEARHPESPIFLSYIPEHLDLAGREAARHSEAIYYVVCDKQPIGAISINHLTLNEKE